MRILSKYKNAQPCREQCAEAHCTKVRCLFRLFSMSNSNRLVKIQRNEGIPPYAALPPALREETTERNK